MSLFFFVYLNECAYSLIQIVHEAEAQLSQLKAPFWTFIQLIIQFDDVFHLQHQQQ